MQPSLKCTQSGPLFIRAVLEARLLDVGEQGEEQYGGGERGLQHGVSHQRQHGDAGRMRQCGAAYEGRHRAAYGEQHGAVHGGQCGGGHGGQH